MDDVLKVTRNGQILEVTLDRPKANAIDAATSRKMGALFSEFRDDPALRVAIITGGGEKFFSAGWDLNAAAEGEAIVSDYGAGRFCRPDRVARSEQAGDRCGEWHGGRRRV